MSTLYTSEKTHQQMLPQSVDAQSAPADNLQGKDETGRGRWVTPATGVQHGRAETFRDHLSLQRHPAKRDLSCEVEDRSLAAPPSITASRVFVVDSHAHPLMPCHPARARKLLSSERARIHRLVPFVIRLVDRAVEQSEVPGVEVSIDPGSKFTGVSVFRVDKDNVRHGQVSIEIGHRGHVIHKHVGQRSAYRHRRRSANLRYRKPRWANRHPESCANCAKNARHGSRYCEPCAGERSFVGNGYRNTRLAPSLQHRVDSTMSMVSRLRGWTPVTAIHLELMRFDMQKMENPEIAGVQYQQGTLAGYEVREYLLEKWGRKCAYCGDSGVPLQVEHILARSRRGTNRVSNLTLACEGCNNAKDNLSIEVFLAKDPKRLAKILTRAKAPLKDAAAVHATRRALWRELVNTGLAVRTGSGGRTKRNRSRFSVPKPHALDAICVGNVAGIGSYSADTLVAKATGRGSYARTRPDKYGFPRLHLPRVKSVYGLQTGDLVRAVVPGGKHAGSHAARISVRSSGSFNIRTKGELMQGISYRHCALLQRGDGWEYGQRKEAGPTARVGLSLTTPKGGGFSSHTHL